MLKLLGLIPLLLFLSAPVSAESLADIARRTAEERKSRETADETAKVYGNEDLDGAHEQRRREAGRPEGSEEPDHATKAPTASSQQPDEGAAARQLDRERLQRARDEAMWRKRVGEATQRLEAARERYDSIKDISLQRGQRVVDGNNRVLASSPEEFQRMVEAARADYEAAEQALESLLESARRAGVPPGWLR